MRRLRARKAVEFRPSKRLGYLAGAVGTEIQKQHCIAALNCTSGVNQGGLYEFVVFAARIGCLKRGQSHGGKRRKQRRQSGTLPQLLRGGAHQLGGFGVAPDAGLDFDIGGHAVA